MLHPYETSSLCSAEVWQFDASVWRKLNTGGHTYPDSGSMTGDLENKNINFG